MGEHIIESEDGKLWYGGGAWTDIRDKAKRYPSEDAAHTEIGKFAMKGKPVPFAQEAAELPETTAEGARNRDSSEG